ncbi:SGNH hydrolase-type esterase domain-containing protein [Pelagophyceae sp. CCMP2097]|nr:SGNH hydrolase-type esterase domain-containing protein [Pelagophyceae sp. CCMP2097]
MADLLRPAFAETSAASHSCAKPAVLEVDEPPTHIFLLVGQSNMAGRGNLPAGQRWTDPRVKVWRHGWELAQDPLHRDKATAAVGPAMAFARSILDFLPQGTVGFVPCAVGGTALERWDVAGQGDLFHTAVSETKAALESSPESKLAGILWHQGESDASNASNYAARLERVVSAFRLALSPPLFILGEVGHFLDAGDARFPDFEKINAAMARIANGDDRAALVSARGLRHKGDRLHFDAASADALGRRYALEFLGLSGFGHDSLRYLVDGDGSDAAPRPAD